MKVMIILILFAAPAAMHLIGKPTMDWLMSNPTMHTKSFGYLPWLMIVMVFFLTPRILKRLKQ